MRARRVLVARQDNAGDVLLAGPAVRAVAANAAEVVLLAGPRGREAAELLPGVSGVLTWHCPWIDMQPQPVDRAAVYRLVDELAALGVVGFTRALAAETAGEVGLTLLIPEACRRRSLTTGCSSTGPARTPC